jgi:shikimate dehydrogenase
MHNAAFAALGFNWRYLAFDVHPDDLRQAIDGARAMKFAGLNLTLPHKLLAMAMVDELDASAERLGAINTILFRGKDESGAWKPLGLMDPSDVHEIRTIGFNTDAGAIIRSLREDLAVEPGGASVLLLGAGGAARGAALQLAAEGVTRLHLINRTAAKAEEIAREIRAQSPNTQVTLGYPAGAVDLVLNATSLGLKRSDPMPFDSGQFSLSLAGAVYDMVYRPAETPFIRAAKSAGRPAVNGLGMLLYQGARALEIWTGHPAPVGTMRLALEESVYGR